MVFRYIIDKLVTEGLHHLLDKVRVQRRNALIITLASEAGCPNVPEVMNILSAALSTLDFNTAILFG